VTSVAPRKPTSRKVSSQEETAASAGKVAETALLTLRIVQNDLLEMSDTDERYDRIRKGLNEGLEMVSRCLKMLTPASAEDDCIEKIKSKYRAYVQQYLKSGGGINIPWNASAEYGGDIFVHVFLK